MITKDDIRIESEILGSFIVDNSTHEYIDKLQPDDFLKEEHSKIFKTIQSLYRTRKEINYFTIQEKSKISLSYLTELTNILATTANIEINIEILKNKSNRRKLIQKANKIKEMALDTELDIDTVKNNAMREIDEIESITNDEIVTLRQAMLETTAELDKRYSNKDDLSYYTGIKKLDNATAGLHKEELTTIGARPGVGKTIIGMQIGLNIALNKRKVMYTSLEMSTTQLCERIISANANVDSLRLRKGDIKEDEWTQVYKAAEAYSTNFFAIDKTSRNPAHIRTKIRKYKPDLLIIDYLQLMQSTNREQSREREIATITRDLKLMALEFKIPIIILSQLNRNAEGKRPTMADLRESGAIEQDSDNIFFLHEPNGQEKEKLVEDGVYNWQFFSTLESKECTLSQLIIEKQRNGPVSTFDLVKVPKMMKFLG